MKSLKFTLSWVNLLLVQHALGLSIEGHHVEQPEVHSRLHSSHGPPSGGFKVQLSRHISQPDTDSIPVSVSTYLGTIGEGSKPQLFSVLFDVNSNDTWVPYHRSSWASGLHYSNGYNPEESKSDLYRYKYTINYDDVELSCYSYNDTLTVYDVDQRLIKTSFTQNTMTFEQSFCAAYSTSIDILENKPFDGVVGLSPSAQQSDGSLSFLSSLVARRQGREDGPIDNSSYISPTSDLVFGVWFDQDPRAPVGGEITFGGIDEKKIADYLQVHHSTVYPDSWDLDLNGVSIDDELVACDSGCQIRPSTTNDYILGPSDDINKIYDMLGAKTHRQYYVPIVQCDSKMPIITFQIDNSDYELTPNDYVRDFVFEKERFCQLMFRAHDQSNWILGVSFMSRYYTIFDQGRRQISFVKTLQKNSNAL